MNHLLNFNISPGILFLIVFLAILPFIYGRAFISINKKYTTIKITSGSTTEEILLKAFYIVIISQIANFIVFTFVFLSEETPSGLHMPFFIGSYFSFLLFWKLLYKNISLNIGERKLLITGCNFLPFIKFSGNLDASMIHLTLMDYEFVDRWSPKSLRLYILFRDKPSDKIKRIVLATDLSHNKNELKIFFNKIKDKLSASCPNFSSNIKID